MSSSCEVIVVIRSRWFREATKYLQITGDLQYITLSEVSGNNELSSNTNNNNNLSSSSPSTSSLNNHSIDHSHHHNDINDENNDINNNNNMNAEQSWYLGQDGCDIISIDILPGNMNDVIFNIY